jgi:hypothetical protein
MFFRPLNPSQTMFFWPLTCHTPTNKRILIFFVIPSLQSREYPITCFNFKKISRLFFILVQKYSKCLYLKWSNVYSLL